MNVGYGIAIVLAFFGILAIIFVDIPKYRRNREKMEALRDPWLGTPDSDPPPPPPNIAWPRFASRSQVLRDERMIARYLAWLHDRSERLRKVQPEDRP